jgi:aspartate 1-decarboxylase
MRRTFLKSKIHGAIVTDANLEYDGSLTLDGSLMEEAELLPYERVEIYNISNGNRFATYLIEGEEVSGVVCVNGAAAHLAKRGDRIIIAAYAELEPDEIKEFQAHILHVDENNRLRKKKTVRFESALGRKVGSVD